MGFEIWELKDTILWLPVGRPWLTWWSEGVMETHQLQGRLLGYR